MASFDCVGMHGVKATNKTVMQKEETFSASAEEFDFVQPRLINLFKMIMMLHIFTVISHILNQKLVIKVVY